MIRITFVLAIIAIATTSIIGPPSNINIDHIDMSNPYQAFFSKQINSDTLGSQAQNTSQTMSSIEKMKQILAQKYKSMMNNQQKTQTNDENIN